MTSHSEKQLEGVLVGATDGRVNLFGNLRRLDNCLAVFGPSRRCEECCNLSVTLLVTFLLLFNPQDRGVGGLAWSFC